MEPDLPTPPIGAKKKSFPDAEAFKKFMEVFYHYQESKAKYEKAPQEPEKPFDRWQEIAEDMNEVQPDSKERK